MVFGKLCIWYKAESFACVPADFIVVFTKTQDAPNPDVLELFYTDVKDVCPVLTFNA